MGRVAAVRRVGERATHAIQSQRWLDRPGYSLEHGVALAFALLGAAARPAQDLLHGTWLGHPLHPTLTDVPIGAWTAALVLDGVDLVRPRSPGAGQAARIAVGVGLVGGVGSALTGLTDWQHTHDNARRLGIAHGALNAAALGLYTRSWLDRRRGRPGRARLAGAVGYGLVLASGYLGGDLVFRHRVGVDHADPDRLEPRDFVPVLPETELYDGIPRRVQGAGAAMVLIRHNGSIHAVGEHCPHLGAPLSQGWLYRDQLVCPWHGSRFDPSTGEVRSGPATAPLPCFQTRVRAGQVEVRRIPPVPEASPGTTVSGSRRSR